MIYTSAKSNIKNIPNNDDTRIILVHRFGNHSTNRDDVIKMADLGPTPYLFKRYKNNELSWDVFKEKYITQLYNNTFTKRQLNELIKLMENYNVILICYESDYRECHRKILAEVLQDITCINYNGEW